MSGKYMGYNTIEEARECLKKTKDPEFLRMSKEHGVDMENMIPAMEEALAEAEKLHASESDSSSLPEPADGETVTKTTVSKSKDGGESALEKAVQAAGGFEDEDEGEGEGGDEDIVDMSDEGAGNLLKVLQSKF